MKKLLDIVNTLTSLKGVVHDILSNSIPIMKELSKDENYIVNEIIERSNCDKTDVVDFLQTTTFALIEDPRIINKEIDNFGSNIENIDAKLKEYPFLANVWYGDYYNNKDGVEAMNLLLRDMNDIRNKINDDWIIENAISQFVNVVQ